MAFIGSKRCQVANPGFPKLFMLLCRTHCRKYRHWRRNVVIPPALDHSYGSPHLRRVKDFPTSLVGMENAMSVGTCLRLGTGEPWHDDKVQGRGPQPSPVQTRSRHLDTSAGRWPAEGLYR